MPPALVLLLVLVSAAGGAWAARLVNRLSPRRAALSARRQGDHADNEAKYRQLFEIERDAVFLIDNESGRILEANPAATQLYGYTHDELLQKCNTDLSVEPELTREAVQAGVERVPVRLHRTRDGRIITVEIAAGYLTWHGRQAHVATMRDITERVQADRALRQYAAELEAQNEELDAFGYMVAHDLQNPLSALHGYLDLLRDQPSPQDNSEQCALILTSMGNCADKMSHIVDDLLLLARVRKSEVRHDPLNMAQIVAEARRQLDPMIRQSSATITGPDHWPVALGYAPWVEAVWVNYLSNALKYGGRPPVISLSAMELPGGKVRFCIHDNGHGLTPEDQATLFAPFTRLHQAGTRGQGLGLSIVRRIVTRLGGEVGIESQVGYGTTFYFTLLGEPVQQGSQSCTTLHLPT